MADQKTPEELAADAAAKVKADALALDETKKSKRTTVLTEDTTTLHFEGKPYSGKLLIGTEEFAVVDGEVEVPGRLAAAAHQAGFKA